MKGFVYLILNELTGLVKVGISRAPARRSEQIGREWPCFVLECESPADARRVERYAHHILLPARVTGEWFRSSVALARLAIYTARLAVEHGHDQALGPFPRVVPPLAAPSPTTLERLMAIPLPARQPTAP